MVADEGNQVLGGGGSLSSVYSIGFIWLSYSKKTDELLKR